VQGGPVDELLGVPVERPALDQLEVEVGRTTLTMEPVRTALCITYERRLGEAYVHVEVSQPQMQDCTAGPVHDVCQQDDDQDHDHQPEEEHDDSGDDVPSYSSRSSHGLQLPGAARIIRNWHGAERRGPCPLVSCSPSWTRHT